MAIRFPIGCDPVSEASHLWDSPFGQHTLALERPLLSPITRSLHGDTVLWIGEHAATADTLSGCMVRSPLFMQQHAQRGVSELACLRGHADELPFQSKSLDAVVLHHALERVRDPRTVLREVTRTVAPGGRVIIVGFNPLSLYGLRRLYARCIQDPLSQHRLVSPLRLFDWMPLLGLELDRLPIYAGYGVPRSRRTLNALPSRGGSQDAQWVMPFGGLLIVSAVKKSAAGRLKWRLADSERRRLAPVAYPRVASWRKLEDNQRR